MILAGLILLPIGLADVLRRFLRGRALWIAIAVAGVLVLVLAALGGAYLYAVLGLALAALWVWLLPLDGRPRLSFWPAALLAVLVVALVALLPARVTTGLFAGRWLATPFGPIGFDLLVLALGVFAVLLETGNVIVRAALLGERAEIPEDVAPDHEAPGTSAGAGTGTVAGLVPVPPGVIDPGTPTASEPTPPLPAADHGFRGGRLIGPLERVLVLLLTLFAAYPLLAAMLAAKGIVRFPEISRDGVNGGRAEYFLVGSLVSWVVALGGALLLWWAARAGL
ncbi:hypothetical protein [Microbacterium sp. 13-71-7]|jgi:hypothetical protein|uniref:hypothetical protein n=1 Tax=Microbacterium sp. 13-71-7 TaxID=1970399 RepID=UPI000BCAF090|nr:hypothetical protein [Microbacterium sp. 13-71-7]OZB81924.1 MAG: hypothetical protein B7X32_15255 [Microbacterium sp. 13-71-7]